MKGGESSLRKLSKFFVFACSVSLLAACGGGGGGGGGGAAPPADTTTATASVAGVWTITETSTSNDCGDQVNAPYPVTVAQAGPITSSVTLKFPAAPGGMDTLTGTFDGFTISATGSIDEIDGGTTTGTVTARLTGDGTTLRGQTVWTWTDGVNSCSGTTNFTGVLTTPGAIGAFYLPVGPQVNVPEATVTGGGWSACHTALYNSVNDVVSAAACNKSRLMLACRPVGNANYTLLAQAPRADVLFDTGNDFTTVHNANGTAWYFHGPQSMGFADQGDTVNKFTCDTNTTGANDQRLCWHTNAAPVPATGIVELDGGYRCGTTLGLNNSAVWERQILHAD